MISVHDMKLELTVIKRVVFKGSLEFFDSLLQIYSSNLKLETPSVNVVCLLIQFMMKKPNKFSICYRSFARIDQLKRLVNSVHEGKKYHKCSICDRSFARTDHLKGHVKSAHEGKMLNG